MSATVSSVTTAEFDDLLSSATVPLIVDFWAEWCKPCHALLPVLDSVASHLADAAIVCKVNVEDERALAARYQVLTLPTVLVIHQGAIVREFRQAPTEQQLIDAVQGL